MPFPVIQTCHSSAVRTVQSTVRSRACRRTHLAASLASINHTFSLLFSTPALLTHHDPTSSRLSTVPHAAAEVSNSAAAAASSSSSAATERTFILGVAVNIACAAMEAYLEPTTGEQYQCRGSNGTITQYVNSAFVKEKFSALLEVTVKSAAGFKGADILTMPDLYVEVSAGGSWAKTKAKGNRTTPEWNEKLLLWPEQPVAGEISGSTPTLNVRVFDEDIGKGITSTDDDLGTGTVALEDGWESMPPTDMEVEILSKGQVRGTVSIKIEPSLLSEETAESATMDDTSAPPQASKETVGADALASIAAPQLVMAPGTNDALKNHVSSAAVLHQNIASIAASPATADSGSRPLPEAVANVTLEGKESIDGIDDEVEAVKEKVREAWRKLPAVFPNAFLIDGAPIAYISHSSRLYDTQVWVHRNTRLKQVVISFRGTETKKITDWLTDLKVVLTSITTDPQTGGLRTVSEVGERNGWWRALLGPISPLTRPSVHYGFYKAYRCVEPQLREVLELCTGGDPEWSITTTGHSLGGALATVCAYDLATSRDIQSAVESFTFGSPRVGNGSFTAKYNAAVPRTFRVHNANDIVAQVPPFFTWAHVVCEARLLDNGRLALREGNPISVFGDGLIPAAISEKLVSPPSFFDGIAEFTTKRLQLLFSLASLQGISSHAGDEYIQSLAEIMLTASADERYEVLDAVKAMREALMALQKLNEAAEK